MLNGKYTFTLRFANDYALSIDMCKQLPVNNNYRPTTKISTYVILLRPVVTRCARYLLVQPNIPCGISCMGPRLELRDVGRVHHGNERHAEIDSQRIDDKETTKREYGQNQLTGWKSCQSSTQ